MAWAGKPLIAVSIALSRQEKFLSITAMRRTTSPRVGSSIGAPRRATFNCAQVVIANGVIDDSAKRLRIDSLTNRQRIHLGVQALLVGVNLRYGVGQDRKST